MGLTHVAVPLLIYIYRVGFEGSFNVALSRSDLFPTQKGHSSRSSALEWLAGLEANAGPM